MNNFNIDEHNYHHIHFIGIGGISMSAIAEILLSMGYKVSGSDRASSDITHRLEHLGATIYYAHSADNLNDADLVIYTDAISLDNPELQGAVDQKLDLVDRATFLGQLMQNYTQSIGVSGTHGKTSTTSMLSNILMKTQLDPTILLGGQLDNIGGNVRVGNRKLLVTEACEYRANILKYFPTTSIILNIDEDHLDYFDNMDHIIDTFRGLVDNLAPSSLLVANIDDENVANIVKDAQCRVCTISVHKKADYTAQNINLTAKAPSYELYYGETKLGTVELQVLGEHNVYNSLAAAAAALELGVDVDTVLKGLHEYGGVHRRLEYKGTFHGADIVDDYAHHPTEIKASISALRSQTKGKLICVFQPHTFTRTKILLDAFSKSFTGCDEIIITDIYAAREKDYGDIHSKTLRDAIVTNADPAIYMKDFDDIVEYVAPKLTEGDTFVTMGAGDVYKIGRILLQESTID
ncbi:UDP-N-acetylmuramate--L-alanine ligase [Peptoniphilus equinus]|uniref:UDP-N-acetylmuramate--L-alanine ligase n=1 Tax=Peptoniphilus equinus TaxID=3016343 RepID=A0ABY7QXQ1_9FIRM|nr:UDP-N-acetylmuramate--L-alanine ligase [Peptoniphilus equinus]WBW50728.1 UDP-N-acetylmuramate--L-alanine ligase [Peptoniphilus equinus]